MITEAGCGQRDPPKCFPALLTGVRVSTSDNKQAGKQANKQKQVETKQNKQPDNQPNK